MLEKSALTVAGMSTKWDLGVPSGWENCQTGTMGSDLQTR